MSTRWENVIRPETVLQQHTIKPLILWAPKFFASDCPFLLRFSFMENTLSHAYILQQGEYLGSPEPDSRTPNCWCMLGVAGLNCKGALVPLTDTRVFCEGTMYWDESREKKPITPLLVALQAVWEDPSYHGDYHWSLCGPSLSQLFTHASLQLQVTKHWAEVMGHGEGISYAQIQSLFHCLLTAWKGTQED